MYKVMCGDCAKVMQDLKANSIDLVVTSPPYDNLRSYHSVFEAETIIKQLYEILKVGGVVVWIVGDATVNGSETGTSFRQALTFMSVGFNLHDTMIYKKKNPMPQNFGNRYEQVFEYMFVFSKGKVRTFNAIKVPTLRPGEVCNWKRNNEQDKKQLRHKRKDDEFRPILSSKVHGNIFEYAVGSSEVKHPAVFPEQLALDHIQTWSNEGETVLDPFMGSGTTGKMAVLSNRNFIGIDISPQYCEMATKRIEKYNEQKLF